jgi:subtilisin-like proprotein convertase family protein
MGKEMKKEYNLYKEESGKTKVLIEHPGKFKNWCIKKWGESYDKNPDALKHLYQSYGEEQLLLKSIL